MEVPPFTESYGPLAKSSLGSPYSISPHFRTFEPSTSNVQEKCYILAAEAKLIFHEGHRCLQNAAKEVAVHMLKKKDWIHKMNVPNCAPMAYCLKGKSLKTDDLSYMTNICCDELKSRNIPILCEVYNRPWQNVVVFNEEGQPLTKLQLMKASWNPIAKMSKDQILQELLSASKLMLGDKDIITCTQRFPAGPTMLCNIKITQ